MNPVVACTNDEWRLNSAQCTRPTSTTGSTVELEGAATSFCIVVPQTTYNSVSNRYSLLNGGDCASSAIGPFATLKECVEDHDSLLSGMKSDFNSNVNSKMQGLYTKLNARKPYYETTRNQFTETNKFIVDSGKTLSDLSSCKIMRREAINMIGNGCYRFGKHFSIQSIVLLIIGPLMILLSFYVCCSVIKSTPAASHPSQNYAAAQPND